MPRLVACHLCKLLQRFPDVHPKTPMVPARMIYKDGTEFTYRDDNGHATMVPQFDPALEDFVERHQHGLDDEAFTHSSVIQVWAVDEKTWNSIDVVQRIKGELHESTQQWYDDRDTYREAAVQCYNDHGNPDLDSGCPDYLDDSKLIGKASYRDEDGRLITIPKQFRQYLCYQCPYVHAYVNVELRRKRGLYK